MRTILIALLLTILLFGTAQAQVVYEVSSGSVFNLNSGNSGSSVVSGGGGSGGASTPFYSVCWITKGEFCPQYDERISHIIYQIYLLLLEVQRSK